MQQFPRQSSFESLASSNNGNSNTRSTIVTGDSLRSSPSLTSLDKISTISNTSVYCRHHFQREQSKCERVKI